MKIYHNPRCTKSRLTLELLKDKGFEPEIIEYLKTPPSELEIESILKKLGKNAADIVRTNEDKFKELNIALEDNQGLISAMVQNPILIERPIVVNGDKAAIGRPPENVLEIL